MSYTARHVEEILDRFEHGEIPAPDRFTAEYIEQLYGERVADLTADELDSLAQTEPDDIAADDLRALAAYRRTPGPDLIQASTDAGRPAMPDVILLR